jgi:ABC-type glutathione transport system ATPase component
LSDFQHHYFSIKTFIKPTHNPTATMSDTGADSGDRFYKHITEVAFSTDIELQGVDNNSPLRNDTVKSFIWNGITVTVKDQKTKQPKAILDGVDGIVEVGMCQSVIKLRVFTDILPGEICALMGPSGCGKTTLLNVLAQREATDGVKVGGHTLVNGTAASLSAFRQLSSYVEQEDALIGSLTVRETLHFAARLAHKK